MIVLQRVVMRMKWDTTFETCSKIWLTVNIQIIMFIASYYTYSRGWKYFFKKPLSVGSKELQTWAPLLSGKLGGLTKGPRNIFLAFFLLGKPMFIHIQRHSCEEKAFLPAVRVWGNESAFFPLHPSLGPSRCLLHQTQGTPPIPFLSGLEQGWGVARMFTEIYTWGSRGLQKFKGMPILPFQNRHEVQSPCIGLFLIL